MAISADTKLTRKTLIKSSIFICGGFLMLLGCSPTVKIETPKEPITINLNIKLDAEVRVKLEESAKNDIKSNPGIF